MILVLEVLTMDFLTCNMLGLSKVMAKSLPGMGGAGAPPTKPSSSPSSSPSPGSSAGVQHHRDSHLLRQVLLCGPCPLRCWQGLKKVVPSQ